MKRNAILSLIGGIAALLSCIGELGPMVRDNPQDPEGDNWNPPVVTAMADASVNLKDSIDVTATATDNGTVVKYVWAKNGTAFVDTTTAGSLKVAYAQSGRMVVSVKTMDDDGVWSAEDSFINTSGHYML